MQEKRIRPIFIVLLCAFISLLCGLGGAYFTITHLGGTSPIVYQSNDNSNVSSVSSDGSHENTNTIRGAVEKAAPAVVEILTETEVTSYNLFGGTYVANNAGSGVILSEDGYIITNNHVVSDAQSIKVTTYDGKQYDAELIGKDKTSDIAVIKVEADNLTSATVGDSTKVQAGDIALVIGNPLGTLGGSVTDGIISAPSREITIDGEAMNLIQTDAEINSGNSGGGLFNGDGNLIGIVNAKDSGTTSSGATIEGIGFAIPINYALEIAEDLIENGKESKYKDFFINWNEFWDGCGEMSEEGFIIPKEEYIKDMFFRKPGLPILTVEFKDGSKAPYWNTFYQAIETNDKGEKVYLGQMDLNIKEDIVWDYYDETLKTLKDYGASIIRLDAFAYAPKEVGKKNFLNDPETWELLNDVQSVADKYSLTLLPEIHATYAEGIYKVLADKGYLVYDFFLPGLVLYTLEKKDASKLSLWANEIIDKILEADGLIVGSPVYYSGPNGALCAVLDRVFYAANRHFVFKPAAAIVSCRRGGASATFDRLNKYFTISNMPVVSSQYWNSVHGNTPEEVKQDIEGLQTMRILAKNMAWILRSIENNDLPELEDKIATNFIR